MNLLLHKLEDMRGPQVLSTPLELSKKDTPILLKGLSRQKVTQMAYMVPDYYKPAFFKIS